MLHQFGNLDSNYNHQYCVSISALDHQLNGPYIYETGFQEQKECRIILDSINSHVHTIRAYSCSQ